MSEVRYRVAGPSFPGLAELTAGPEGVVRLRHETAAGVRGWIAEPDPAVWPWLLEALREAGFPDAAPEPPVPGGPLCEITVTGTEPAGTLVVAWPGGGAAGPGGEPGGTGAESGGPGGGSGGPGGESRGPGGSRGPGDESRGPGGPRGGLGAALRILDALMRQVGGDALGERGADVPDELPPLARRRAPDPAVSPPAGPGSGSAHGEAGETPGGPVSVRFGAPGAAAFGVAGGRPAYAVSRPGVTFALYGLPDEEPLGGATVTDTPAHALALGTAGGRDLVAAGGDDGAIRVWDTADGRRLHAATGHGGPIRALAASGGLVYTGGDDGRVRVWDAGGSLGAMPDGHEGALTAACAHGGLLVTGGEDGAVHLLDAADGRLLRVLGGHDGWVNAVAAREGLVASAGSDRVVRLWDPVTGEPAGRLDGHGASVTGLAFLTVAGRAALASCGLDGEVVVWDLATGGPAARWRAGAWAAGLTAVGDRLVSAGDGVRVWAADGTPLAVLATAPATAVAASAGPRGERVVAGFPDGVARVWRLAGGEPTVEEVHRPDGEPAVDEMHRPDGEPAVDEMHGPDGDLTKAPSQEDALEMSRTDGGVTALALDGTTIVCGTASGAVRLHGAPGDGAVAPTPNHGAPGGVTVVPTPHSGPVTGLALDGGLLVSGGLDGTVRTWDALSGRPLRRLIGHPAGVTAVVTGRVGGRRVIASSGYDRAVRVWDLETGEPLLVVHGHPFPVYALAFGETPDGRTVLASGSYDGRIPVRDPVTGEDVAVLGGAPGAVRCLSFLGPGVLAAGAGDGVVRVWRLPGEAPVAETRLAETPLALSPGPYAVTQGGSSGLST
ncbi:WD40 repeat domain-containing protein [Nonomuraea roseoviolacea]|uniref:WD40 repeat protein n=1 Tax=Nonomuraea roseoviolacea subsp. carminata TaxID=160689 RepID=A0ABT1JWJ1_9ACTN|nr:WD40 repeat domain-containing protein [Nonomuraea roseoviolacea]MCP2345955.1 WD40 repeat protein [Nonomuraea roseoviolacea subsp. carminata]